MNLLCFLLGTGTRKHCCPLWIWPGREQGSNGNKNIRKKKSKVMFYGADFLCQTTFS
jgi:hypothetical protein